MTNNALAITEIRHWIVHIPLENSLTWASGKRTGSTRLICEISTEAGIKGYGETICLLDFVPKVFEKVVVPLGLNRSVSDVERLHRHAEGAGYYHHKRALVFALSALEMAMWDALGKYTGLALHQLWGGLYRSQIELCAYVYITNPKTVVDELLNYKSQGFRSFKLKVGLDQEQDVELVKVARETLGPNVNLRADPNGAWTLGTARRMIEKFRPFDLQYIEQPLPVEDLVGLADLRKVSPIPICIDEGAYTIAETMQAIRLNAIDVVLVDPHETGGLWQCLKQGAIAESAGIHVGFHSGGELGLTQAANLQLAATMPNATIAIDTIYQHHADDILNQRLVFENGSATVPTGPGLGVEVNLDKLEQYKTDQIIGAYLDPDRPEWFAEKPVY